jgi:UPF0176 protein
MMNDLLRRRNKLLSVLRSSVSLPGSVPYDNYRPINIPERLSGRTLFECLCEMHPHISAEQWRDWFGQGHVLLCSDPMPMDRAVRGGEQYRHLFPDTVEPDVDGGIRILWEDDAVVAVCKPAPLPVHPCGRFNRNTLTELLRCAYGTESLRVVHRLDANTTGVLLLARSRAVAKRLSQQFDANQISKRYLVRCHGLPGSESFTCNEPIARKPAAAGLRRIDPNGQPAETEFRVLSRFADGTAMLEARPLTGRTNQIRIHLWTMSIPVVGDPAYLPGKELAAQQTLGIDQPPMCLHASSLSLDHPGSGEPLHLAAPDPAWVGQDVDSVAT